MPRGPDLRPVLRTAFAVSIGAALLASCGGGLRVDAYPTEPGTEISCRALLADTPPTVNGLEAVRLEQRNAAVWGAPPVVLRCGVETPAALTPTSPCDEIAGIGWFTETTANGLIFTTIGRRLNVSVEIPDDHQPSSDVLIDLAGTVAKHVPVEQPCA